MPATIDRWVSDGPVLNSRGEGKLRTFSVDANDRKDKSGALLRTALLSNPHLNNASNRIVLGIFPFQNLP